MAMTIRKPHYIESLISMGESENLDFKFAVNDSLKIAKSLVAFANRGGGTLLIGVKDNGSIVGVKTEEEYYMVHLAASYYCRPEIEFSCREWNVGGKRVLEVMVLDSNNGPYRVKVQADQWRILLRIFDSNVEVSSVVARFLIKKRTYDGTVICLGDDERRLLHVFGQGDCFSEHELIRLSGLPKREIHRLLVNLLLMSLVEYRFMNGEFVYSMIQ
jgi:hypothetical protein